MIPTTRGSGHRYLHTRLLNDIIYIILRLRYNIHRDSITGINSSKSTTTQYVVAAEFHCCAVASRSTARLRYCTKLDMDYVMSTNLAFKSYAYA